MGKGLGQLKNVAHGFDLDDGDAGVTIRKGLKWANYPIGDTFQLRICDVAHDGICNSLCKNVGVGRKIGSWSGSFANLPPSLVAIEHNKEVRDIEKLKILLTISYGSIEGDDLVTALIYVRGETN